MSRSFSSLAIFAALALSAPVAAQQIVVTGRSLKDTEAALKACLERKCPPEEDIAASLAHAENLFANGDYDASSQTLSSALGRNKRYSEQFPVPISDLYRANGRISEHQGEAREYQFSVLAMRDVLKKGVGPDDFRTLVAQIEVGDSRAKLGFPDEARRIYADVEERALKLGQNRVATYARLRQALIFRMQFSAQPTNLRARDEALKILDLITVNPLPGSGEFVLAADIMRGKLLGTGEAGVAALVKRFAEAGGANRPVLLYSEALETPASPLVRSSGGMDTSTSLRLAAPDYRNQWADVGFWIGADGHVSEVEVLRSSGSKDWIKPVLGNIKKRIYAPLRTEGDAAPGFYMIERYTLTARFEEDNTGTRIRRREPVPRIERLDITPENYEAPPGPAASAASPSR